MKTALVALAVLLVTGVARAEDSKLDQLLQATVMVRSGGEQRGSGCVFNNGAETLIWTAAHILDKNQKIAFLFDPKRGELRIKLLYSDVTVVQPIYEDGRKVGETTYLAKILRYSDARLGGDDLALLRVYKRKAFPVSVSFIENKKIPKAGTPLWHVGSPCGDEGINTPAEGMFSVAGRLLRGFNINERLDPKVYDQITLPTLGGCSGGGVYLKSTGECVGLLTQGLTESTESFNYIVPSRRIRDFAKRTHCEWAIDTSIKIPDVDDQPIADCEIPLPRGWTPTYKPVAPPPGFFPARPTGSLWQDLWNRLLLEWGNK